MPLRPARPTEAASIPWFGSRPFDPPLMNKIAELGWRHGLGRKMRTSCCQGLPCHVWLVSLTDRLVKPPFSFRSVMDQAKAGSAFLTKASSGDSVIGPTDSACSDAGSKLPRKNVNEVCKARAFMLHQPV